MLKHLFISFLLLKLADLTDVTYYEILGVSKQATAQEIRQAYKKLAIKYHPDKNPEAAQQEMFLKITEAYENLKDPDKRHNYDTYGKHHAHSGYGQYGYRTQADYNNLFYNGLYHDDPFVDTLSGGNYFNYLQDGFHFINFYSPFCPPCKKLSGDWKNLAKTYKGIVKVGAVNCKYYSNFCYNSMHIGSYPTLIFYPNGRKGSYVYYRGQHTMEALNDFVMAYIRKEMHVPVIAQIRNTENPIAYVLGSYRIERDSLTRIAYSLKGLVTLAIVEDDALRSKLTEDDNVAVVFKFRGRTREIESTGEREVLNEIVAALPRVQTLNPDKLKQIRDNLRSASRDDTWVIYFTKEGNDHNRLKLLQMTVAHPNMKFGEIDCDAWSELCSLLQVEDPPAWGVLKPRGGYQRVWGEQDIQAAAAAYNLQTLSISEFTRALAGDTVTWVLLVVPHKSRWEHRKEAFTKASIHYNYKDDINFGILVCTAQTDKYCRQVANDQPVIIVQRGSKRHYYLEDADSDALVEYIELLMDTTDMELSEDNILQIMDASSREHTWVVAFLPANCGQLCDRLLDQWRKVHKKLRPLEFVRVGALQCAQNTRGFCTNIRTPTARLYPLASTKHYTVSLQQLSQAPYMCEWALEYVAGAVQRFSWQTFNKLVLSEDLRPTSGKSPWLVYFHSPRCFHCYEMYPDFAITGINLGNAVQLGKVNCLTERGLCQHEQITSYPSVRLYLNRNEHHKFSFAIPIPVRDHETMMREIQPHLKKYDPALKIEENLGMRSQGIHMKHDEF